ncbi:MAG: hypothetical protein ACI81P_000593 [Neolewinella sp.]|jgi:hypothetical protein
MLKVSLPVGDDLLEIHHNMWAGKDSIYWNGNQMSRKRRFLGSTHVFRVPTGPSGQDHVFRVRISIGLNGTTYSVKRNDKVLLGTWRDKLTYDNRRQMPETPGLDLNAPPTRRRRTDRVEPVPSPAQSWREEDLIV